MQSQYLRIILAATEDGRYLAATAEAAIDTCRVGGMKCSITVVAPASKASVVQEALSAWSEIQIVLRDTDSLGQLYNSGADASAGELLLFLREGILLEKDALQALLNALVLDESIAAVAPFTNRTIYSWQDLNAAHMQEREESPSAWLRRRIIGPTDSIFLENFMLLMRRSVFERIGKFSVDFQGTGGEDIDLSFRLKCAGYHLLRVPVYLPHAGAQLYDLLAVERTSSRPLLLERWGLDVGVPEKLWSDALTAIDWQQGAALIRATCRSALLSAPLVSIMIPTYNRPEYFRETLESALMQTYPNIEVIVCDNSTDDRTEILMLEYQNDIRVRYIRNKAAKTKAENFMPFEHLAQGEFLQWCMDDDILLPDKITLMIDAFLCEPTAVLVTSVRGVIDGEGAFLGLWQDAPPIHGTYGCFPRDAVGHAILMDHANFLGEPSAALFRRRDLTHHYWRAESRGYETISDCAMWLELLEKGDAVIFGRPLSLFRQHGGQEGQQPHAIVLSRVEWRRLIEDYWRQRVFLTDEDDYRYALRKLEEEREEIAALLPCVSAALRQEYEAALPDIHIMLMNRIEGCASIRLDAPLKQLEARSLITLGGCVNVGDVEIDLRDVGNQHDSILLLERSRIECRSGRKQMLLALAERGNILLQEFDDHPGISKKIVQDDYFTFRAVSAVQTSTKYLADFLRQFNPYVYLFENQLESLPERRTYDAQQKRVTIFFGALNRRPDWEPLMPAINEAIRRYGDRLYFRVISDHGFYEELRTEAKEFAGGMRDASIVAPYERYTAALHASDIALLPLRDTEFNRAKSDLKFIESAGHGAVALASPTVYAGTVRDGETGLIYHSPKEFAEKLDLLIQRADLRRTLAENAYRYVAEHRLLDQHLDEYIAAYREMFARREEFEQDRRRRVEEFFPKL